MPLYRIEIPNAIFSRCLEKIKKQQPKPSAAALCRKLLLHDFQNIHGANLNADAAGDALGNGIAFLMYHDLHGADLDALAALDALLLIDHVNAGLGILGDGFMLAGFHALAALDADIGLSAGALGKNLDAGIVLMEFLVKSFGASADALQTSHALGILLNSQLLHSKGYPFSLLFL